MRYGLGQWMVSHIEIDDWLCCDACRYIYFKETVMMADHDHPRMPIPIQTCPQVSQLRRLFLELREGMPNLSKSELASSSLPRFLRRNAKCVTDFFVSG